MGFTKQTYRYVNMRYFVPSEYFEEYHYWERYDPKKVYRKDTFFQNFGKGLLDYGYCLFTIFDGNKRAEDAKYVVTEEVLSDKEMRDLAPYCQCDYHRRYWFNPLRFLYPPRDAGCLGCDNSFPIQGVIDASKKKKKERIYSGW